MLIQAAVQEWSAKSADCKAENSMVRHSDGRRLSFGQLCQKAATLPVPPKPLLKDSNDYRIIGSKKARLDIPDKVAGRTQFGIDFALPNMITAAVARPPAPRSYPDTDLPRTRSYPGARSSFQGGLGTGRPRLAVSLSAAHWPVEVRREPPARSRWSVRGSGVLLRTGSSPRLCRAPARRRFS